MKKILAILLLLVLLVPGLASAETRKNELGKGFARRKKRKNELNPELD